MKMNSFQVNENKYQKIKSIKFSIGKFPGKQKLPF